MPEREKQIPDLQLVESDGVPLSVIKWDSLFNWVGQRVSVYYSDKKAYSHPDILKYSLFNFLLERGNGLLANKGSCLMEIFRYCPDKRIESDRYDYITIAERRNVISTKETRRLYDLYKTNVQRLSQLLPLNKLENGGKGKLKNTLSFWIIANMDFENPTEEIDGRIYSKESWFRSGFTEILFDPGRGVVGRTYGSYFPENNISNSLFY